ncbi:DUF2231 domain-containing protein [Catenuloplanes atrovinosus]|uniref:DUF2231 domain-containing protein n=1 Tax=Catenuloplanes atrovinosus TaxID=137266 RepID=A0AAE3YWP3_9ACTN|nr:DUF2231 domain-containing protein [Catenuloplanes atrovinosus]MDR7280612.1 hypothetical protein [Catenuloplanes atrovinosus]
MFETINGMPAHVLMVHAAVVFVPLLALGAIVFAVWPAVRGRIDWAVALLAVVAPLSALFSMLSGNAFYRMREADGTPEQFLDQIGVHASYGQRTFVFSLGLAVVTGALLLLTRRATGPKALSIGLSVVAVVLAVVTGYFVVMTGDSGAAMSWKIS